MKITQVITDGCDCYPWHTVFAWLPVKTITGRRIWWEKVMKRKIWVTWGSGFHVEPHVEYATLFEVLNDDDDRFFS
jgi:hypothetical protein